MFLAIFVIDTIMTEFRFVSKMTQIQIVLLLLVFVWGVGGVFFVVVVVLFFVLFLFFLNCRKVCQLLLPVNF